MRRREFITGVATTPVWPLVARAQQPSPVVGFLNGSSPATWAPFATAFRTGLKEIGFIEGQNVAIEYRWAEGRAGPLTTLAAELVDRKPGRHSRRGWRSGCAGREECNHDNADFVYQRIGPGQARSGC